MIFAGKDKGLSAPVIYLLSAGLLASFCIAAAVVQLSPMMLIGGAAAIFIMVAVVTSPRACYPLFVVLILFLPTSVELATSWDYTNNHDSSIWLMSAPLGVVDIAIVTIFLSMLASSGGRISWEKHRHLCYPLLALFATTALSYFAVAIAPTDARFPIMGLDGFVGLFRGFLVYYIACESITDLPSFQRLGNYVTIASCALPLYSFYLYTTTDLSDFFGRAGTVGISAPNVYAGLICLLIPMMAAQMFYSTATLSRVGNSIAIMLNALGMFITGSRGAFITIFGTLVILGTRRRPIIMALMLMALIGTYATVAPDVQRDRLEELAVTRGSTDPRVNIYREALREIGDYPIFGVGPGNLIYQVLSPKYTNYLHAHNFFLDAASKIGIPGALAWLWFWIALFRLQIRGLFGKRRIQPGTLYTCSVGILAGTAAFLVQQMSEIGLLDTKVIVLFWTVVGASVGLSRMREAELSQAPEEGPPPMLEAAVAQPN